MRMTERFVVATLSAGMAFAAVAQDLPVVTGTVESVDAAKGRIAIHHEAIPNLSMDGGMTMVFKAGDAAMLGRVKPGQTVRFTADYLNGQFTLTRLQAAE